jgi:hypothetical protein
VRVVCAACNSHYADLDDAMPFAEKLVWSDSLAEWHGPHCTATREEHQAALQLIQAVEAVEAS